MVNSTWDWLIKTKKGTYKSFISNAVKHKFKYQHEVLPMGKGLKECDFYPPLPLHSHLLIAKGSELTAEREDFIFGVSPTSS